LPFLLGNGEDLNSFFLSNQTDHKIKRECKRNESMKFYRPNGGKWSGHKRI
jgi:hypothetical protein